MRMTLAFGCISAFFFISLIGYSVLISGFGTDRIAQKTIADIASTFMAQGAEFDVSSVSCEKPQRDLREPFFTFVLECQFPTTCERPVGVHVFVSLLTGGKIGPDPLAQLVARKCIADVRSDALESLSMDQGG
jgi:hypothetical protein